MRRGGTRNQSTIRSHCVLIHTHMEKIAARTGVYVRRSKHLITDDLAYRSDHAVIDISCGREALSGALN